MNAPPLSLPGTEECPICLVEVSSGKVLPCSHILCQPCLATMTRSRQDFRCHVCRTICSDPQSAITKYFGSLKCPTCLKLKDVDEFVWCKECERLLCWRCLAKDHKFPEGHTLLDWSTKEAYEACFKSLTFTAEEISETEELIHSLLRPVAKKIAEHLDSTRSVQSGLMCDLATTLGIHLNRSFFSHLRPSGKNEDLVLSLAALVNLQPIPSLSAFGNPKEIENPEELAEIIVKKMKFEPVKKDVSTQKWPLLGKGFIRRFEAAAFKLAHQSSRDRAAGGKSLSDPTVTSQEARKRHETGAWRIGGVSHSAGGAVSPSPSLCSDSEDSQESQETNELNLIQPEYDDVFSLKADAKHFGPISRTQADKFLIGQRRVAFALIRPKEFHLWSETGQHKCYSGRDRRLTFMNGAVDGDGGLHVLSRYQDMWFYSFCNLDGEENSIQISVPHPVAAVHGVICCTDTGVPFLFMIEKRFHYNSVVYEFSKPNSAYRHFNQADEAKVEENFKVSSASAVRQTNDEVLIFASDRAKIIIFKARQRLEEGVEFIIERWLQLDMENCFMLPTAILIDAFVVIKNRNRCNEEMIAYKLSEGNAEALEVLWKKTTSDKSRWLALGANEKGIVAVDYDGINAPDQTYEIHYY